MIKANELRIGNHVLDIEGIPGIITSLHRSGYCGIESDGDNYKVWPLYSVNPIPLTPEILEKCGFKKYSHEPGYSLGSDEKDEICDEYSFGKLTIMDWGNGFVLSNSFSFDLRIELKYLHQLQNLYFALTGEELNYQP